MSKKRETPSERAIRRVNHWIRTNKSGKLHKAPALDQAQLLIMLALAGMVDNVAPRGVLTGRRKPKYAAGLGPTVQSLATITRITRRWAGETLWWLSHPIADVDGQPLDLRGDSAPSGGRVPHTCEVVFHNPFILIAPGGAGGGRRNRIWLHPAFYEGTDQAIDMLEELPPWPYDPRLKENSVPIQMGTGEMHEGELSSHKPEESNTAGAALPGDKPTLPNCPGAEMPEVESVVDDAQRVRTAMVDVEGVAPGGSSPGSAAPAVLDSKKDESNQGGRVRDEARFEQYGRHPVCQATVSVRDQFEFLVQQLGLHGVTQFDLMAPDRIDVEKPDGKRDSKNVGWRWTYRDAGGRRQNTAFGEQAAYNLGAGRVLVEFDRSLPAILGDRVGARGKPTLGRDFYWRAARGQSWSLIVLDDVVVERLPACRRFILQTSEHKYQALLLCDEALDADDRHELQSYYVRQKICDPGASGGIQPVRPPGSINRKPERDSFVTRLIDVQLDAQPLCVTEIRKQMAAPCLAVPASDRGTVPTTATSTSTPSGVLGRRSGGHVGGRARVRTDDSASADDLSVAMSMLKGRAGQSGAENEVRAWLMTSAIGRGKKADAQRYADTTLKAAQYALAHDGQLPETPRRAARRTGK
ncbi:MAG: DNA-primase RepB domain-containing protein [Burkholderiales bacterium]